MKTCLFDGCKNTPRALGYCQGHYRRIRLGKPLGPLAQRQRNKGRTCAGPECGRPAYALGLCGGHKSQRDRGRDLSPLGLVPPGPKPKEGVEAICSFVDCDRRAISLGLCGGHVTQKRKGVELRPLGWRPPVERMPCAAPECDRTATRKGWCDTHYRRVMRTGSPARSKAVRAVNGRRVDPETGYVALKRLGHVEAKDSGWGAEHRIVMSDALGRPLHVDESVHHRNGQRGDNRLENLELWSRWQPVGQRVEDKVAYAKELLARYAPECLKI